MIDTVGRTVVEAANEIERLLAKTSVLFATTSQTWPRILDATGDHDEGALPLLVTLHSMRLLDPDKAGHATSCKGTTAARQLSAS